jgi:hypothetical protein
MEREMKQCRKCGIEKDISEFYHHPKMADGFLNVCKECSKRNAKGYREMNIERIRAYDRVRGHPSPPLRPTKGAREKWIERNPKKRAAHLELTDAIKKGLIVKPSACELCGEGKKLEAHHRDYSEPLAVVWLCVKCHNDVHRKSNAAYLGVR